LPDSQLGVLLPIRLKAKCTLCHGPKDEILTEIREALVAYYPADQANGFQAGDFRGWFWATVPAGATLLGTPTPSSASDGPDSAQISVHAPGTGAG
jgi:hypothetical protein